LLVREPKHGVCHPTAEGLVVHELLEELGVVLEDGGHDSAEGLVVLDAGVLLVGILLGVLVGGVCYVAPPLAVS